MEKFVYAVLIALFFIGCAYAGWYAGQRFPWWLVLFCLSLAALVVLDRRR